MYNSAQCQECGDLFERTGQSLIYCDPCLEVLDHQIETQPPNDYWSDEFRAAIQDWERNL